jgi:histidine triad (HIT) family protein
MSAKKLYEDDQVIVILDHRPVREGHAMVIPKAHINHFIDLDSELAAHICKIVNLIGKKIQALLKPKRVGFVVSGFGVPHAHYHVIPLWDEHDITSAQYVAKESGNVTFNMDHIPFADNVRQNDLVKLLKI